MIKILSKMIANVLLDATFIVEIYYSFEYKKFRWNLINYATKYRFYSKITKDISDTFGVE